MKKILVAEDDKFLDNAYRVKLTKAGFEVKIVRDGKEALEVLKTFLPDIIILDLVMPIKDGFATLEELKQDPRLKNIPVMVASNLGQKEDEERVLQPVGHKHLPCAATGRSRPQVRGLGSLAGFQPEQVPLAGSKLPLMSMA